MELDSRLLKPIKDALAEKQMNSYPPRPLIEAVRTLIGEDEVTAALSTRTTTDADPGHWRCVLLTAKYLVVAEAQRDGEPDYDLGSREQEPTLLVARRWRRDQVARVEVRSLEDAHRDFGTEWVWHPSVVVVLDDGSEVHLPPEGGNAYRLEEGMSRILSELS